MFPLVIKSQRNAAKMHNVMPQMMELQDAMQAARVSGNQIEGSVCLICENEFAFVHTWHVILLQLSEQGIISRYSCKSTK